MEIKIEKSKPRRSYTKPCPFCDRQIKGWSLTQLDYNLRLHIESCADKEEDLENE